jgi:hypothetical protein
VSLVVESVAFNAPFAMDFTARGRVTSIIDTVPRPRRRTTCLLWSDRSGRHHHATQLARVQQRRRVVRPALSYTRFRRRRDVCLTTHASSRRSFI